MKVKNLKIMAAGLAISIIGCTMVKDSSFSHLFPFDEQPVITFEEVSPNSVYFHKTIHDTITLQDVILTNKERNIEENNSDEYQQIINSIEDTSFPIQQLHIEENLTSAFLSSSITHVTLKHQNHQLYDHDNNDIVWDKVLDIWVKNSEDRVKLDKQYQQFAHSQNLYLDLSMLENDKMQALVIQMRGFINRIRKEIPTLDMQRIACQLEEMSFCYTNHDYHNALLVSDDFTLLFPNTFGISFDTETMNKDLFHEFKHMIATPCIDEIKNQYYYPSQTGIYTLDTNQENRMWYYLPFDWLFLEEAGAETFSSELVQQLPITYQTERQFSQDMLYSISLMPNFDKDIFVKCSLLHNPIALLQQFPIPNSNSKEWLYQNAKMLECYNILSNDQALLNYILNIEELEDYQNTFKRQNGEFSSQAQEILLKLEDTADLQLLRIFLVNIMNSDRDLSLEDYLYFYQLMELRIQNHREAVFSYYGITMKDTWYQEQRQNLSDYFMTYLNKQFLKDVSLQYQYYTIEEQSLSNAFTESEKRYYTTFVQTTLEESLNPIFKEKGPLDKILTYYLGE